MSRGRTFVVLTINEQRKDICYLTINEQRKEICYLTINEQEEGHLSF